MMNKDIKVSELKKEYDNNFIPSQEYLDSMPDLQNGNFAGTPIDYVGIQDFKLPIRIEEMQGGTQEVKAEITGMVSLEAHKRGINMSRILRSFYKSKDDVFNIDRLNKVLNDYKNDLDSFTAHILMNFEYRIWQKALRSLDDNNEKEGGWQYYDVTFDTELNSEGKFRKVMWVTFTYSSACPCSTALSEHAAYMRGEYGIPHSQRSFAKIGIEFDKFIWIEEIIEACRRALKTEVLVFCKRQDEQAFAVANGSDPKFVEDAVRNLAAELDKNQDILDYKLICSHQESLHAHNCYAVKTKGLKKSRFDSNISIDELRSMGKY